jgi:hypothetical protein
MPVHFYSNNISSPIFLKAKPNAKPSIPIPTNNEFKASSSPSTPSIIKSPMFRLRHKRQVKINVTMLRFLMLFRKVL